MEKIKLGIIGLGLAWERLHAPAFERLKDRFEIVAVCDTDENKAREAAVYMDLPATAVFSDYNKMLARANIEAVDCIVPIRESFECAAAVIKSGKHLITEKPLAHTPKAAKELIQLKNRMKIKMLVAENIRYEEQNIIISNLISDGHIGNVVYFIDNHVVEYEKQAETGGFAQTEWRQHPHYPGGVLLDSGVHHVARMRFLFGNILSVAASGRPTSVGFSPYSCANALFTFHDNIAGHYSFFMAGKETQAPLVGLRIFGTHGEIFLENRECGFVNVSYRDGRPSGVIPYTPNEGYYHELEDFHTAIRFGGKVESTPEKALGDMETIFNIMNAIKLKQTIRPETSYEGTPIVSQMYIPRSAVFVER